MSFTPSIPKGSRTLHEQFFASLQRQRNLWGAASFPAHGHKVQHTALPPHSSELWPTHASLPCRRGVFGHRPITVSGNALGRNGNNTRCDFAACRVIYFCPVRPRITITVHSKLVKGCIHQCLHRRVQREERSGSDDDDGLACLSFSLKWMTVSPVPFPDAPWIADDQHTLSHPCSIIHLLYPPLEHGMSHEPLEVHVKPVTQSCSVSGAIDRKSVV